MFTDVQVSQYNPQTKEMSTSETLSAFILYQLYLLSSNDKMTTAFHVLLSNHQLVNLRLQSYGTGMCAYEHRKHYHR